MKTLPYTSYIKPAAIGLAVIVVVIIIVYFVGKKQGKQLSSSGNKGLLPSQTDYGQSLTQLETQEIIRHADALYKDMNGLNLLPRDASVYTEYLATSDRVFVGTANAVAKSDITALGIPAQDTTYSAATASKAGLMSAEDKNKLDNISNHINPYASLSTEKLTLPLPYLFDAQTGNLMQGKYSGFEFTTFLDAINDVDINQEQLLFKALTTSDAYNARFYISIVPEKSSLKIWDSKSQEIYAYINNAGMFSVGPESYNGHISLQVRNGGAVYFQHTLTQYVCIKGFMTFRVLIDDNLNN